MACLGRSARVILSAAHREIPVPASTITTPAKVLRIYLALSHTAFPQARRAERACASGPVWIDAPSEAGFVTQGLVFLPFGMWIQTDPPASFGAICRVWRRG